MKDNSLNIKSEKLFPFQFQLIGIILVFFGIGLVLKSLIFGLILFMIGILILTAYNGVIFNKLENTYWEYNSFLGYKTGKPKKFDAVELIYVNERKTSQRIYTRVTTSSIIKDIEYNSYMKFTNGTKIYLTTDKNKERLMKKLAALATYFQQDILDNTV